MNFPPRLSMVMSGRDMAWLALRPRVCTPLSTALVSISRSVMWPKAERKLSGVLPSWSRFRLRFALFLRAWRLETGGGEIPGLP